MFFIRTLIPYLFKIHYTPRKYHIERGIYSWYFPTFIIQPTIHPWSRRLAPFTFFILPPPPKLVHLLHPSTANPYFCTIATPSRPSTILGRCVCDNHDSVCNLLDAWGVDVDEAGVEVSCEGRVNDVASGPKTEDEVVGVEAPLAARGR